ncbi:MAG TPA: response regulator [Clostridiaceae bacterium]|nr:response regulator [Clostridiaceae bacterium]
MFNVLLVDDDQIVVEGLRRFVNWNELGYQVINVALSEKEAIKIIETEYVDVVLTDIVMPGKSGLDLIKEAHEINPYIKIVILSGYGEFEFAKQALKLGAFDYLMKPVNFSELINTFDRLKSVLKNDIEERQKQKEFLSIRRMQFMNNLVNGYFSNIESINRKAFELGMDLSEGSYCLIRIYIDENLDVSDKTKENDYVELKLNYSSKINDFLCEFGRAFVFDNNLKELCVLFYPNDINNVESTLESLLKYVNGSEPVRMILGVGGIYDAITDAPNSYTEAGKALEYCYEKDSFILFYNKVKYIIEEKSVISSEVEEEILKCLINSDIDSLEEYILKMLDNLKNTNKSDKSVLYNMCLEILHIINKYLSNFGDEVIVIRQNSYNTIISILRENDFDHIKDFFSGYLRKVSSVINENKKEPVGYAIEKVIKYIDTHYNEDISLNKLSEIAYLHPIYLSKLFKEKTGENFTDYLVKVRIENAKKLLRNLSLRIYDISEMVGYDSSKHFSKVFKEITGITPRDYRNQFGIL